MNNWQHLCPIVFFFSSVIQAQHLVLLRPVDAVQLVEGSDLFRSHYASHGCPRAEAGIGPTENEIRLKLEDGCIGGVSTWAGDYILDRSTGELRVADDNKPIVIKRADPILLSLWRDIESRLLTEQEAECLVSQTPTLRMWRSMGIATQRSFTPRDGSFLGTIVPADNDPRILDLVLRFTIDRAKYRVFHGRFSEEDLGEDVLSLRRLLLMIKRVPELTRPDVIEGSRNIPEVKAWLEGGSCRGIRLDEDQEGATYYDVELFHWCAGEARAKVLAGFAVEKRSGGIRGPQGITIGTQQLPRATARLSVLATERTEAEKQFNDVCEKARK